jgi:hypothetical protein
MEFDMRVEERKRHKGGRASFPKAEFKLRSATTSKFNIGEDIALATAICNSSEKLEGFCKNTNFFSLI